MDGLNKGIQIIDDALKHKKEEINRKARERYANMSKEKKKERNEKARERYAKKLKDNKEEIVRKRKEKHACMSYEKRLKISEKNKERYVHMSQEKKKEISVKRKSRKENKEKVNKNQEPEYCINMENRILYLGSSSNQVNVENLDNTPIGMIAMNTCDFRNYQNVDMRKKNTKVQSSRKKKEDKEYEFFRKYSQ